MSIPPIGRARGALLGLAVGDALGTTHEFAALAAPPFPRLATGPLTDIVGGGPFGLIAGQVTDDTQMACCLAASLRERGTYDPIDAAKRYLAWSRHAFDIGTLTSASLSLLGHVGIPADAGRRAWQQMGRDSAGNGSLMRTAPIGVFYATREALRREASLADSAITHFDPRCRIACAAFNAAIALAVAERASAPLLADAALREVASSAALLRERHLDLRHEVDQAEGALLLDLEAARRDDPELYGPSLHMQREAGFVRVGFRLAFWEALHAPTFSAGLIDVANRGGDADTNCAIAGALLGALHGEESIPCSWRDRVLSALQDGAPHPLRDAYHPKELLRLLDAVDLGT